MSDSWILSKLFPEIGISEGNLFRFCCHRDCRFALISRIGGFLGRAALDFALKSIMSGFLTLKSYNFALISIISPSPQDSLLFTLINQRGEFQATLWF
jgi:hypothetical protein